MGAVVRFACPKTGDEIDPGIEEIAFASTTRQFTALHVRCRHCGEHHEIKIEEAALNEAA